MHLKRFRGKALPEVMRQVRDELGPEAVILHTRSSRSPGLLGLIPGGGVEVVAALDRPDSPVAHRAPEPSRRPGVPAGVAPAELAELKELIVRLGGGRVVAPALAPAYERLIEAGLHEALAFRVIEALRAAIPAIESLPPGAMPGALEEGLAGLIGVTDAPPVPRAAVVALVGPAGSGKTTTLAKLAARARLEGRPASIVSLDGMTLGTASYLETLATILEVPCALALTRQDLGRAIERTPDGGLLLLDSPAVSPGDVAGLMALGELLQAARPGETHLVLSATSKTTDALAAVCAYAAVGVNQLLFTRLDETRTPGSVLAIGLECGLPLSYVGTGRDVPSDLQPARAPELARRILRGDREP